MVGGDEGQRAGGLGERLEHRPADQLLDERGCHAGHPVDGRRALVVGELERHAAGVDLEQPGAGVGVRQPDLDGDVHPPGPGGEGRLEQVGPVGGQQEQQVGVLRRAVHGVEQLEQDGGGAGPEAAVLRDQVDVLEHQRRGLQVPGQRGDGADHVQRLAGHEQHRGVLQRLDDVADGVRLAGPGRAVQQQPALEVLAGGAQLLAAVGHVQAVPLDPAEHLLGQHDVLARGRREPGEDDVDPAGSGDQLEELPAVDVEPGAQLGQLAQHLLRLGGRETGDLEREALALLRVRALDQQHRAAAGVLDEQQAEAQAGQRAVGTGRQLDQVGGGQPYRRQAVAVQQLLQAQRAEVRRLRQAVHRGAAGRARCSRRRGRPAG